MLYARLMGPQIKRQGLVSKDQQLVFFAAVLKLVTSYMASGMHWSDLLSHFKSI